MATKMSEVREVLRSLLLCNKTPITEAKLAVEYETVMGIRIPFREYGFSSVHEFLDSLPDVVKFTRTAGGVLCEAVRTRATEHISNLVSTQKNGKLPKSARGRAIMSSFSSQRRATDRDHYRQPAFQQRSQARSNYSQHSASASWKPSSSYAERKSPPLPPPSSCAERRPSWATYEEAPRFRDPRSQPDCRSVQLKGESLTITISRTQVEAKSLADSEQLKTFTTVASTTKSPSPSPSPSACSMSSNSSSTMSVPPTDVPLEAEYVRKLLQILDEKCGGLYMNFVEATYEEKFHERLPGNWKSFLKEKWFQIEPAIDGRLILYRQTARSQNLVEVSAKDFVKVQSEDFGEVQSQSSTSSSSLPKPSNDKSQFSKVVCPDNFVCVHVTVVNSTTDVWIRPQAVWDEHSELATSLELHYLRSDDISRLQRPKDITVGDVYATEADASCSRVKVLEILPNAEVLCLFVDHGEINVIKCSNLWVLEPLFKTPRFMVRQCELHGLEGFSGCESNVLFNIVDRTYFAEIVSSKRETDVLSIVLFDTSSDDDDVNVNEEVRKLLLKEVRPPQLQSAEFGLNSNVYLSHVVDTGYVYLQIQSATFELLESLVDSIPKSGDNKGVSSVSQNAVYLAQFTDDLWYRVICISGSVPDEAGMLEVFFVDYGNTDRVSLTKMIVLKDDNETLAKLPYQAIRCRLHKVPIVDDLEWTKKASERLAVLAPDDLPLIAKVIPDGKSKDFPLVELFKRLEPKNELVSINETLNFDGDLFAKKPKSGQACGNQAALEANRKAEEAVSSQTAVSNSAKPTPTVSCSHLPRRSISPIPFPSVGEQFDILVTLASNPFNFMVQYWLHGKQLDQLLVDMNEYYETKGRLVASEDLVNNGLYAYKHHGLWYRVRMKRDGLTDLVSVYLIDYGEVVIASAGSLRILEERFRVLPSQVIRARLSDIEPINGDWLPEDSVLFRNLVQSKTFVAVVVGECPLDDDTDKKQLELMLIDTSSVLDVYVHDILIERGIAVAKVQ